MKAITATTVLFSTALVLNATATNAVAATMSAPLAHQGFVLQSEILPTQSWVYRKPGAVTASDYRSNSGWTFSRIRLDPQQNPSSSLGRGWRHNFEVALTRDGDALVVHDEAGQQHRFESRNTQAPKPHEEKISYTAADPASGHLHQTGNLFDWIRSDGTSINFAGSNPIRISRSNHQELKLTYASGVLVRISDSHGDFLELAYQNGLLSHLRSKESEQTRYRYQGDELIAVEQRSPPATAQSYAHSPDSIGAQDDGRMVETDCLVGEEHVPDANEAKPDEDDEAPRRCTTESSLPESFQLDKRGIAGAQRIDLRPASCQSYFVDYYGVERGDQIEDALGHISEYRHLTSTSHSFPVIDFQQDNELIAVTSRDLAGASLDPQEHRNALYNQLMRDGERVQTSFINELRETGVVTHTEQGNTTTIVDHPELNIKLQLIVQHGMADSRQIEQIQRARQQLRQLYGIVLEVIEIP